MSNVVRFTRNTEERKTEAPKAATPEPTVRRSRAQMLKTGWEDPIVRRRAALVVAGAATLWASAALYGAWTWEKTDNAYVEAEVTPISSRIMGYVREVATEQNQEVKKDSVLVTLDDADLRIELQVKEARFRKASADFSRAKRLMSTQALAQSEFESVQAAFALAQADLDGTKLKLEFTQVRAPMSGTVAKLQAHRGQFVQPGQAVVTLVATAESAWVKANFKETQIAKLGPGMRARLHFDSYPNVEFEGKVDSVYPSSGSVLSLIPPENATGNFTRIVQRIPVKISVTPREGFPLRPGMSASVEVDVRSGQK